MSKIVDFWAPTPKPTAKKGGGGEKFPALPRGKNRLPGVWMLIFLPDFLVTALKGTRADVVQGKKDRLEGP